LSEITFGPVSVHPQYQKKGVGSALIKESLARAKDLGFKAVVITGYPGVYRRFGFKCTKEYNLRVYGEFAIGCMALELQPGYLLNGVEGGGLFFS
jgi:predicted N-acetyltransferase YhbS